MNLSVQGGHGVGNHRKDACCDKVNLIIDPNTMAVTSSSDPITSPKLILPNLGRKFSGVTSTLLQVLPYQMKAVPLVVWGKSFIPEGTPITRFLELLSITKELLPDGTKRVYHARRNIEMLWGLILKEVFGRPIKLVFTSTAQRIHTRYTRFLIRRMDAIITTSNRAGSFLEKPADYVVPHGIAISNYPFVADKSDAWKQLNLPGEKGIGIFGRVRPQKGVDLFVDAMIKILPQHPEYTAVIVGRTTPKFESFVRSLKGKISRAGLEERFAWMGEVDFVELPALFGAMSIVAAVSRVEGFGLTCLEAMSSGAPVIASRTGGFELVVRDGVDGIIVDCGDSNGIANAFRSMASEPKKLVEMSLSARARIEEKFTVSREASELIAAYNEVSRS